MLEKIQALQALDTELENILFAFLNEREFPGVKKTLRKDFAPGDIVEFRQFLVPWLVHHLDVDGGRTVRDLFLAAPSSKLGAVMRRRLEAHAKGWISIFEVVKTKPGTSVQVRDRLTGDELVVHDAALSEEAWPRAHYLARVVPGSLNVFSGRYPAPLGPYDVDFVMKVMSRVLQGVDVRAALTAGDEPRRLFALWDFETDESLECPDVPGSDADIPRWLGDPNHHFGRWSPLEAVRLPKYHDEVRALVEQMEYLNHADPHPVDVDRLRRWLGLTSPCDFDLRIEVRDLRPRVWRRLRVPGGLRLSKLHDVLQIVFGWLDYHLHCFSVDGVELGNLEHLVDDYGMYAEFLEESEVRLDQVLGKNSVFTYNYDFGDDWWVDITVERIVPAEVGTRPRCLAGERAGPHEDCGGVTGYHEMVRVLANPRHPDHQEMRAWAGRGYRPGIFDVDAANRKLIRRFPPSKRTSSKVPRPDGN